MSAVEAILIIAGLGGLGALLRWGVSLLWQQLAWAPAGAIVVVNSVGCLAVGILGQLSSSTTSVLVAAALVGSFTTLSSLAVDVGQLARAKQIRRGLLLLALHIGGGFLGYGLGVAIAHVLVP